MNGRKFFPLVVIAAGLLAYSNSFSGGFFLDDFASIPENPTILHLWPIRQPLSPPHRGWLTVEGRPLINLSLAINYAISGYHVWSYHALNLIVHILAALTLLGIVRRTLLQTALRERFGAVASELALATALLWMLHPLQTEAVTYVVQRAESVMGLFYLLTLYCFIRSAESAPLGNGKWSMGDGSWKLRSRVWYGLSVAACALGMACKEVMVTAPVMVLLYDRAFLSGSFREAWQRRRPLYLGLAGTWIVLGVALAADRILAYVSMPAQRHFGVTWWQYLATEPGVILYYLRLFVWPAPLTMDHAWPIAKSWLRIVPPAVAVLALVAAVVWVWKRNTAWGFAGVWFFLVLAPSSSFVPLHDALYEHRLYLPLAGLVSLVVMGLYALMGRKSLAVFAVAAVGLGVLTWRHNRIYYCEPSYNLGVALGRAGRFKEAIAQLERAVRIAPDNPLLRYNYGVALMTLGRPAEALEQYEAAVRLKPDFADAHANLANLLSTIGKPEEAVGHYEQALRVKPNDAQLHYNFGVVLLRLNRLPEAISQWGQAVRFNPDLAPAHNDLGIALERMGRVSEAIQHYEAALRINPNYPEAHNNLGLAFAGQGKLQAAMEHWQEAARLKPDFADPQSNLGGAYAQLGRMPEAIAHWEQALRIDPDYPEANYNLGVALAQAGKLDEAIDHYHHALKARPGYAMAHYSLGLTLAEQGRIPEAIAQWNETLRIKPDFAEAHYNLAVAAERQGHTQEAIEHYEQALRIRPGYTDAKNRLARLRAAP